MSGASRRVQMSVDTSTQASNAPSSAPDVSFKYGQVERLIEREIARRGLKPGDRLPTRQALCRRFSVAPCTVTHAIGSLISRGVLTARRGSGTFVGPQASSQLVPERELTFTVLVPHSREMLAASSSPHTYLSRIEGISRACDRLGHHCRLRFINPNAYLDTRSLLEAIGRLQDGVVIFQEILAGRLEPALRERRTPFAVVGTSARTRNAILRNDEPGYRAAFEHLARTGRTKALYLGGPPEIGAAMLPFLTGWARRAGVSIAESLLGGPDQFPLLFAKAAEEITQRGVQAILARTDALALGLLRSLQERGLDVPGHVSLIGFDDVAEAAAARPPLSTIRVEFEREGELAIEKLSQSQDEWASEQVPTRFIARGTTLPETV